VYKFRGIGQTNKKEPYLFSLMKHTTLPNKNTLINID